MVYYTSIVLRLVEELSRGLRPPPSLFAAASPPRMRINYALSSQSTNAAAKPPQKGRGGSRRGFAL